METTSGVGQTTNKVFVVIANFGKQTGEEYSGTKTRPTEEGKRNVKKKSY